MSIIFIISPAIPLPIELTMCPNQRKNDQVVALISIDSPDITRHIKGPVSLV